MTVSIRAARHLAATGVVALLATLTAACEPEIVTETVTAAAPDGVTHASVADASVAASAFLFDSASGVVLVPAVDPGPALARARALRVPALPDTEAGRAEATRLGAEVIGEKDEVHAATAVERTDRPVIATGSEPDPTVATLAQVGGAELVRVTADPRTDSASIAVLRDHAKDPLLAVGVRRYPLAVVRADAETIAGGHLALPGHHYLALYGHPATGALGVLGEQGPKASVVRARKLVRKYRAAAPKTSFQPAFEIIATVASASKGKRGDYSQRTSVEDLRPLVDTARKAGVTVILDLQPGRGDALEQAKAYRELLREPHVGLAIDPEWKLGRKGKPLQRIGHMSAGEINRVSAWLARLTRTNTLPQKLFVVHQFQTQMVRDRDRLVTDHPELATVIHVDGQGPPAAKHGTWQMIRKDAPPHVFWGWKNFVDEDEPMLNAAQTWRQVRPHPDLITYQ